VETVDLARETRADWVVLDGYCFGTKFQQAIKDAGKRLLVVDDDGCAGRYVADLILNQNPCASPEMYASRNPGATLLLGARYALLRREFFAARPRTRTFPPQANCVLMTLGGADPEHCTGYILDALTPIKELQMIAVVGPNNPRFIELEQLARRSRGQIAIQQNPPSMPELMSWANLAISAAGTTCWEMAFMGLPMILVAVADNQRLNARCLGELGVARNLGWWAELSSDRLRFELMQTLNDSALRASMSQKGLALVDDRGANRVVTEMRSKLFALRRVSAEDSRLLLEWANEPAVRAASFSPAPISTEEHNAWFTHKLDDPTCAFFIAMDYRQTPLGQVRFDQDRSEAVISVSVDRRFRGQGAGAAVIALACRQLFKESSIQSIHAYIKPENPASISAFADAGFEEVDLSVSNGRKAAHLVLHRKQ
jgi:UDP-2,4-diacetamido-2,4,6-trideoxy-beta-L-altropyranose hydrolase